ncbi:hypothetical protein DVH24_006840, partial [Malus domestica]
KRTCQVDYLTRSIVQILTRYLLQKLFSPGVAGWFFLDGVVGCCFQKRYILYVRQFGHSNYLGSLTTFNGWNQKMLELSVEHHWVFALLGFLMAQIAGLILLFYVTDYIGLFLAAYSIIFRVETARGFRHLLDRSLICGVTSSRRSSRVDSYKRHLVALAVFLLMLGALWGVSGILLREEFNSDSSEWFLAWLNGRGLGMAGLFKWVLFGTLSANVSAACIMVALSTVKKAVSSCDMISVHIHMMT